MKKLRNKKTGKIVTIGNRLGDDFDFVGLVLKVDHSNDTIEMDDRIEYHSLDELNEDWEDYKPTEPLIKDEKIRKAVRAWAVANRVAEARYSSCHDAECEFNARDDENKLIVFIGNFQEMNERLDITGRTIYTIEELCGEEEE